MPLPALTNFANYLAQVNNYTFADLYTFQLQTGEQLRYSGGSQALTISGTQWASNSGSLNYSPTGATFDFILGPAFGRSKVSREVGVKPTELEITIMAGPNDLIGNLTWQQAMSLGLFDYATVELDRYLAGPNGWNDTSNGAIVWFYGQVGDVDFGRSAIKMKVFSLLATMNQQQMPRRIYGATCTHVFGDNMCLFNRESMAVNVTAQSSYTTQLQINTGIVPNPVTLYNEGTIISTSGNNNGYKRTVRNWSGTIAQLLQPFLYTVNPGDTFTVLPGCDHTLNTCQNVFNNLIHYGGMPYIPPPELAV
jgi:uncharacterized phage protein (TIGR02218 family)